MTNYFIQAKNEIKSILESISSIKYVYSYEKGQLEGYPTATIYSAEYNPEWQTTNRDKDVYTFTIHLYQEMTEDNKGAEDAESIVDSALVEIMQAIQQDFTLDGKIEKATVSAVKGWTSRELPNRAAVITVTCWKSQLIR